MTNVYKNGVLTGKTNAGKFVPTPTVPTGDAFDNLWDDCCKAIDKSTRLKDKLSGDLRGNSPLVHANALGEEITIWIQQGDLRSYTQVNDAVRAYSDHWDRLITMGAVKEWKLELYSYWHSIKNLRWFFGVQGAKPLPTKAEVLAERKRWEAEESERIRRDNNIRRKEKEELAEWEKEQHEVEDIKGLTKKIAHKLFSLDRVDLDADPLPPEYKVILRKRRTFVRGFEQDADGFSANDRIVKGLRGQGKNDDEISKEMITMTLDTLREYEQSEIQPLAEGEERWFLNSNELRVTAEMGEALKTKELVLRLGMDGLWVMDTAPLSPLTDGEKVALEAARAGDRG